MHEKHLTNDKLAVIELTHSIYNGEGLFHISSRDMKALLKQFITANMACVIHSLLAVFALFTLILSKNLHT